MATKVSCYDCKHRGEVPGDAHSSCNYPGTNSGLLDMFNPNNRPIAKKLNIQADAHGIASGWFMWPCNFDPVWLENCDGFESKLDNEANIQDALKDKKEPSQ
jgi:hypothetical protein